jgi:hypothetical protein
MIRINLLGSPKPKGGKKSVAVSMPTLALLSAALSFTKVTAMTSSPPPFQVSALRSVGGFEGLKGMDFRMSSALCLAVAVPMKAVTSASDAPSLILS